MQFFTYCAEKSSKNQSFEMHFLLSFFDVQLQTEDSNKPHFFIYDFSTLLKRVKACFYRLWS